MKNIKIGEKNMVIRVAVKEDAAQMVEYINIVAGESDYLTFGAGQFNVSIEEEAAFIESCIKSDNMLFLVGEIDGRVVGSLTYRGGFQPRTRHTGEFGITVLKEYWDKGIAKELITYLIDWAKYSKVITKINLRVRTDNERAIKLYKKLGFKNEGTITREFLIDGIYYDTYFMGMQI